MDDGNGAGTNSDFAEGDNAEEETQVPEIIDDVPSVEADEAQAARMSHSEMDDNFALFPDSSIQTFVDVTATDKKTAFRYLTTHSGDVDAAVFDYFSAREDSEAPRPSPRLRTWSDLVNKYEDSRSQPMFVPQISVVSTYPSPVSLPPHPASIPAADGACYWALLPDDVLANKIGFMLNVEDVCRLQQVNKQTRRALDDDLLWRSLYLRRYGPGHASREQVDQITGWKQLYMRYHRFGYTRPGFARQRHIVIRALVRFFLCLFLMMLSPFVIMILLTFSHRSARVVKMIRIARSADNFLLQLTTRLAMEVLYFFLCDCICLVGLPLVCSFLTLATVYRWPLLLQKAWKADDFESDPDLIPFRRMTSSAFFASLASLQQGLLLLVDVLMLVFFVLPVMITVYRFPALCRSLRKLEYEQLLMGGGYNAVWQATRVVLPCRGCFKCCTGTLEDFVVGFVCSLVVIVLTPLILATLSHRAVLLVILLVYRADNVLKAAMYCVASAALILFDVAIVSGLAFVGWFIVAATVYRVPKVISWMKEADSGCDMVMVGFYVMAQGFLVIVDLIAWPIAMLILLITVHKLVPAFRQLRELSYEQFLTDQKGLVIAWKNAIEAVSCKGCAAFGEVVLTFLIFLLIAPPLLIILLSCSQYTVRMIGRFSALESHRDLAVVVLSEFFAMILDLSLLALNFIGWFIVVATVYRLPFVAHHMFMLGREKRGDCEFEVNFTPLKHGVMVLLDIGALVFMFIPILVTCHQLPAMFRSLREQSYMEMMHQSLGGFLLPHFKRLLCCTGCCTGWLSRLLVGICAWLVTVLLAILITPFGLVTLLSCSHHSVLLISRLTTCSNKTHVMTVTVSCFFGLLFDVVSTVGTSIICWWLTLGTLYRAPAMLLDVWEVGQERHKRCTCYPVFTVLKHGVCVFGDVFSLLVLGIPLLVTCHRLPYLARRLRGYSYRDLMRGTIGVPMAAEFREIGYSVKPTSAEVAANAVVGYQTP